MLRVIKLLTNKNHSVKLQPSEIPVGGCPLSLKRLFCFKVEVYSITAQDSAIREDSGCSLLDTDKSWAFYLSKLVGGFMLKNQECLFCKFEDGPFDHLFYQYALINFAIEGAIQIMQAEYSNLPNNYPFGLSIAWAEFNKALQRYVTSKGDGFYPPGRG